MRSMKTNQSRCRDRASGFSLLEMMTVVAISLILTVVSVVSLVPVMKQYRVTNAYNTTLSALRQARDNAVSQRTSYQVTFSSTASPNTITVTPTLTTFSGAQSTATYQLPSDISFITQTQFASATPPDSFGAGTVAIDFGYTANGGTGGSNTFYFCPDGSAQSTTCGSGGYANNWDGGVVYLSRSGDLMSSRAITLWGATGRIHGWRFYNATGGGYQWVRQ
ncbi:MAG: prepilin-type N-terminal cleavage/methylation domain-containing protein [Terriglobales bacterium]